VDAAQHSGAVRTGEAVKLLRPLTGLYAAAVAARNSLYDGGAFKARQLSWPVISVGNLRVGGAGKTPFVIMLGELLQQRKLAFDVLSRGYGRQSRGIKLVDEKGSAGEFGDEPLLIANKLGVPVIVGEDRYAAGKFAEQAFAELRPAHGESWMHILDDGFQHRGLARDFDIVLVTKDDIHDQLLPAGRLRESLDALRRADVIVMEEGSGTDGLPLEGKQLWRVKRRLEINAESLPKRLIVICGTARPERFVEDLRQAGVEIAAQAIFRDHHTYGESDVRKLLRIREQHQAGGFVTTEKDAINLAGCSAASELKPLIVVPLKMELLNARASLDTMLATIAERRRKAQKS
jgi:tetraacyldisaccharide 4'-kinase